MEAKLKDGKTINKWKADRYNMITVHGFQMYPVKEQRETFSGCLGCSRAGKMEGKYLNSFMGGGHDAENGQEGTDFSGR